MPMFSIKQYKKGLKLAMKKIKSLLVAASLVSLAACQSEPKVEEGKIGGTLTVVTSRTDADELFASIEEGFKAKYPEVEDIIWVL